MSRLLGPVKLATRIAFPLELTLVNSSSPPARPHPRHAPQTPDLLLPPLAANLQSDFAATASLSDRGSGSRSSSSASTGSSSRQPVQYVLKAVGTEAANPIISNDPNNPIDALCDADNVPLQEN